MKQDKAENKEAFLIALADARGNITEALRHVPDVKSRRTIYNWMASDEDFRDRFNAVREQMIDFAETCLFKRIAEGDNTSTIFYLKTIGRNRGYDGRDHSADAAKGGNKKEKKEFADKAIEGKKRYITKTLKNEGLYSPELGYQIGIAAELLVAAEMLRDQLAENGYNVVIQEKSREGDTRIVLNPLEKSYRATLQDAQKALTALGMNYDSKKREKDDNSMMDKLSELNKVLDEE